MSILEVVRLILEPMRTGAAPALVPVTAYALFSPVPLDDARLPPPCVAGAVEKPPTGVMGWYGQ